MPGQPLKVIFSGDAQPLFNEMARIRQKINSNIGKSLADWMISGNAPNPAGQVKAITNSLEDAVHAGFNLNGVIRETIVIFREIGRGNWARIPGSFSLVLQYAGALRYLLNPIVLTVAAIGGGIYFWARHLLNSAEEVYKFSQSLTDIKGQFEQQAEAIKRQSDNLREAAKSAEEFHKWLKKLGEAHETLEQKTEDEVKALKSRFELEQKSADLHGQTEPQKEAAAQAERQKEAAAYTTALATAQKNYNKTLEDSKQAEADLEAFQKNKQTDKDAMTHLAEQARKMDEAIKAIREGHPDHYADIQNRIAEIAAVENAINHPVNGMMANPAAVAALPLAKQQLENLMNSYFPAGDGKSASLNELNYVFSDEAARARLRAKTENELIDTEQKLKDALTAAQQNHEKNNTTITALTRRQAELRSEISDHNAYDTGIYKRTGGGASDLTANQRLGAFASRNNVQFDLLKVQQKALVALETIAKKPGGIPGYGGK